MTVALQYLAETGRDADPPFFVCRMVETSTEHRIFPLPPTTSHSLPPQSSQFHCRGVVKIDDIALTNKANK